MTAPLDFTSLSRPTRATPESISMSRLRRKIAATPLAGSGSLKIKLNDQERRALGRALVERKARLIESTGDTTQTRAAQRAGLLELSAIASVLRKLRRLTR